MRHAKTYFKFEKRMSVDRPDPARGNMTLSTVSSDICTPFAFRIDWAIAFTWSH